MSLAIRFCEKNRMSWLPAEKKLSIFFEFFCRIGQKKLPKPA